MTIDAINDEVSDYVPVLDLPKAYLLPFSKIEAALRFDSEHSSKFSRGFFPIVIPHAAGFYERGVYVSSVPVDRLLEERGFRFADNPYVDPRDFTYARADHNQPEIILCKNLFKKAMKGIKKGAKKLGKNVVSVAKHGWHEVTKAGGKVGSWAKDHKTELIVGAVVVAAVVVAILAAPAALPAAAAAAAVPALDSDDEKKDSNQKKDPPAKQEISPSLVNLTSENGTAYSSDFFSPPATTSNYSPEPTWQSLIPTESQNGIPAPGEPLNFENIHYRPWENPFPQGVTPVFSETEGYVPPVYQPPGTTYTPASTPSNIPVNSQPYHAVVDPSGPVRVYSDTNGNYPQAPPSHIFVQVGKQLENKKIFGFNGIGNQFADAQAHAVYLQQLSGGYEVNWVFSNTQSIPIDVAKAGASLLGYVSPEAKMLEAELLDFHYQHLNDPNAKCFLSCHSRGAIDVKNALLELPPEVRQRVIVVAVAPAVVVPQALCHRSFNYATKGDPVPHLQTWAIAGFGLESGLTPELYQDIYDENHRELIMLEKHPDQSGIGHEFQEPGYAKVLQDHLLQFVDSNYNDIPRENAK